MHVAAPKLHNDENIQYNLLEFSLFVLCVEPLFEDDCFCKFRSFLHLWFVNANKGDGACVSVYLTQSHIWLFFFQIN